METIEIDLNEYPKELLVLLIEYSCKRKEPVDKVIAHILQEYVSKFSTKELILEDYETSII